MLARHTEPRAEHAARTVRCVGAQRRDRQRRQPAIGANPIQRGSKVGRRIGQRAIEVEQHRAHGQRARRSQARTGLTHRGGRSRCS